MTAQKLKALAAKKVARKSSKAIPNTHGKTISTIPMIGRKPRTKAKAPIVAEEIKQSHQGEVITLDKIVKDSPLQKKYVFMNDTIKVLEMALMTRKNVILFGKGGHGKSELTIDFLQDKGIEPFVMTMGSGTTTDKLFGGIDLKLFNEEGKIQYLVENSFMNEEFVVFEELFDAPDYILEQLKDILSSGIFRNGTQVFPIKTKLIICCTNKTREQFSKNDSLKALMERFPLEQEVKWDSYNATTYEHLLKHVRGYADPMLTYILQEFAKAGYPISPRIAITAADLLARCGPDCLSFVADFNIKKDLLNETVKKFKSIYEIKDLETTLKGLMNDCNKTEDTDDIETILKKMDISLTKLANIKADDSIVGTTSSFITKFNEFIKNKRKDLKLLTKLGGI